MKKTVYVFAPYFLILFLLLSSKSWSQDQFVGEIKMFVGNLAPRGWAKCEGQILPIQSYHTLYSILGPFYGGNGTTTFALPDLRGNVPVGVGRSSGQAQLETTLFYAGTKVGTETNTLTIDNLPPHHHSFRIYNGSGTTDIATGAVLAVAQSLDLNTIIFPFSTQAPNTDLKTNSVLSIEGNFPINNIQPSVGVSYIIALEGYYPSRS
ncbi:phage tail protein [Flavobacterium sp. NKUCC04_CG]|uniref:phage tail protein n=1 Tax=Flavobacterium sp. NKUCC04_CG TaxID=2842121 RepID=UPI001C5BA858|nr:tail fiber protein [Flavobacterium sp. NKUCC04_CG]MBW3517579.1 tail fiber protein [Flavobacterium sp. NKUCC04_CG]